MADVSVRPATVDDVHELARIQLDTWRLAYQTVLPAEILDSLTVAEIAASWHAAITTPPTPSHRVLVATEGAYRVGFAAFGPDADRQPDDPAPESTAAVSMLLVEPRWGRRGHGSRLLAAVADLAKAGGADRLVAWVPAGDSVSLRFYRSAGWEPDGLRRDLDTGAGTVTELRLHTALAD
ncbi:GNAT family N-acetyltransferase [Jatrophihabitans sp.]|uniref:GNAT family N-acetyltransferase n=1 Tax=Jatrophihabitans sp. TaxID=1932789 RepID=UPI002D15EF84|nr:GNAT family N-acetyltransferase [Jatrophihabitans sp.]